MILAVLRSAIYTLCQIVITPLYFLIILAAFPLPTAETLSHHLGLGASDAVSAAGYLRHPLSCYRSGTYPAHTEHHTVQASIGVGNACISVDLSTAGVGT